MRAPARIVADGARRRATIGIDLMRRKHGKTPNAN
jgi:hypothetical protein